MNFNPVTGTRFRPNTSQQLSFDITMEMAKNGSTVKEIRERLAATRRENGAARDLDAGYFNLATASHPEFFEVWSDGTIKVLKEPAPDKEAIKAEQQKQKERKERASKARGTKTNKKPAAKGKGKLKSRTLKKK